jgi:hypothetical protein
MKNEAITSVVNENKLINLIISVLFINKLIKTPINKLITINKLLKNVCKMCQWIIFNKSVNTWDRKYITSDKWLLISK